MGRHPTTSLRPLPTSAAWRLSYMGREPFRRLRRAVGHTSTPEPSDGEGGSGPAGAQVASSPYRLDPAVNAANQVTASSEATSSTYSFVAAVSSPAASMATQDPVWPPSVGGTTALEDYLAEQQPDEVASMPATAPTTLAVDDAQPGVAPPKQGEDTTREGPPTPGATRSRANKIGPQRRIQPLCCPLPRGQSRRSANWRTKLVGRQSLLCRACRGSSPRLASLSRSLGPQRRLHPPYPRRIPRSFPTASRPPPRYCTLRPQQLAGPGGDYARDGPRSHRAEIRVGRTSPTRPLRLHGGDDFGPGPGGGRPEHYPFRTALRALTAVIRRPTSSSCCGRWIAGRPSPSGERPRPRPGASRTGGQGPKALSPFGRKGRQGPKQRPRHSTALEGGPLCGQTAQPAPAAGPPGARHPLQQPPKGVLQALPERPRPDPRDRAGDRGR